MEKEFIPYEQALALKELGFDEKCGACYYKKFDNEIGYHKVYRDFNFVSLTVSAPTFSQAFRWFREKYDLHGCIDLHCCTPPHWFIRIDKIDINDYLYHSEDENIQQYSLYKEAELECLIKLIEIVENKTK